MESEDEMDDNSEEEDESEEDSGKEEEEEGEEESDEEEDTKNDGLSAFFLNSGLFPYAIILMTMGYRKICVCHSI